MPNNRHDRLSALLLSLDPGGRTGALPTRPGVQEFAYCIRGKVQLTLGNESYELSSGDSAIIDQANASWVNRGRNRAEVLIVSSRELGG